MAVSTTAASSAGRGIDAIKLILDESRILAIGSQVVLGVDLRMTFEDGFDRLPPAWRVTQAAALLATAVALTTALWPAAWHRMGSARAKGPEMSRLASRAIGWTLAPLALGTAGTVFLVAAVVAGGTVGVAAGAAALLFATAMWLGIENLDARALRPEVMPMHQQVARPAPEGLGERIDHLLTETRVVLPGSQAMLAFQSAVVLTNGFAALPREIRYAHLASVLLVAIATVLLIAPAAYHRIVERGGLSERFHAFGGRLVTSAMAVLALGICTEVLVVAQKVSGSDRVAMITAGALLAFIYGIWFAVPIAERARRGTSS